MNPKSERARRERELWDEGKSEKERDERSNTRGRMGTAVWRNGARHENDRARGDAKRETEWKSKIENGRAILTGSLIVGRSGLSARTRAGSVGPPRSISAAQHSPLSPSSENEASLTRVSLLMTRRSLRSTQPRQVSLRIAIPNDSRRNEASRKTSWLFMFFLKEI